MPAWIKKQRTSTLYENENNKVPYLAFAHLEACGLVSHGISTRLGGVSEGHLASMNLSFTRGDRPEAVRENYRRMGEALGFSCENLALSDQTHTTNVRVMTEEDRGKGFLRPRDYKDVDGLVTNVPELVLATFYADCVPLFFVDPVNRAIGLSHSGWRGTAMGMGRVTLEVMRREFGTDPAQVLAAIGPSICQDCYEVSGDVIEEFQKAFPEEHWPEIYCLSQGRRPSFAGADTEGKDPGECSGKEGQPAFREGKYQLDLWRAHELLILEAGGPPEQLSVTDICTRCHPGLLFSPRASKGKRGNLGAFLMLRAQETGTG